jgi:Zn-dependent peptidase ImmA (M78 family)/predicted HTH domain antitoxin
LHRLPAPYSTQPRYNVYKPTPAAARWMANQERARLGLPLSSPIRDMRSILQSQRIRVMGWDLVTPKLGGCFIFSPTLGSFVLVKRNLKGYSANMINFVLAHEYCHDLIHRQQKGITCDPSRHYRKPEEYFAQWFAANFLMPEEALVPRLQRYLEQSKGVITAEIIMNLALDFGVSYKAMLTRMSSKGVELIDVDARKQLEKVKVTDLLVQVGRSVPQLEVSQFPVEYMDMAFEAYNLGQISLGRLAELLNVPIEEAKAQLEKRNEPVDLGVSSEDELLRDIENA